MQASSLQLESSAITRLKIEANKSYPKDLARDRFTRFGEAELESMVEVGSDANDKNRFFVKLEIKLPGSEETPTPYVLDLEIIGIFRCDLDDPEKSAVLVEVNGPAVIYGSIRELVMQITSRGPFAPLVLPTVNFVPPETEVEPDGRPAQ